MSRRAGILSLLAVLSAAVVPGNVQFLEPAPVQENVENAGTSLERVIGEVTATDPSAKQITVKADAGGTVTVIFQERTLCLRLPPGETDLKKAVKITPAEVGVGDRVYARGHMAEDTKSLPAVAVIVITKAELARKQEREREEWQKRAVAGTISALNPETKQITLSVRSPEGTRAVVIESAEKVIVRRYAPDSVRFREAKPSSFAELKVGDSLRVLGEKNADGSRIKPEEIVSGSVRTIAGIINAIDATAGEIKINDLQTKKPLTVRINSDSMIRRIPATMAAPMANRPQAGSRGVGTTGNAGSEGKPSEGAQPGAPPRRSPQPNAPTSESRPRTTSGGMMGGGGGMDFDRMPALPFAELKRGETILVSFTVGAEPSRVTAIVLLAGAEPLLSAAPAGQPQTEGIWNFFDISLP
ncbi:MAG: hypothetical protein HY644_02955 [Acidobacteria bacterium]|nr:hypothetical protein [Acidobacteriota bacterium]